MARTRTAPTADDELLDDEATGDDSPDLTAEFDEPGEDMPKAKNGTDTAAPAPKYDSEGWALNKAGKRDSRWKAPIYNPETGELLDRSARTSGTSSNGGGTTTGRTRAEKVLEIFGKLLEDGTSERGWTYVSSGSDPNTRKSPLGANLKEYHVIRDKDGNELVVGRGEMAAFAGVTIPKKERPASRKVAKDEAASDEFAEAFDDEADVATDSTGDELLDDEE